MPRILITDPRFEGRQFHGGINGEIVRLDTDGEIEVGPETLAVLNSLGVTFCEVASGADAEGSGVTSAPTPSEELAKFDHDGDGHPGGSKKKAARKPPAKKAKK